MDFMPVDSREQEIINQVQQVTSSPKIVIIADRQGEVLELVVNGPMRKVVDLCELPDIAKMISMRYDVESYDTILDGLQTDRGIFKHVLALSIMIDDDKILIVLVPQTTDMSDLIHIGERIKNISISPLANLIGR